MVGAQSEQARDRFGTEARGGRETSGARVGTKCGRCVGEPERADESRVELRDGHGCGLVRDGSRGAFRQAGYECRELALREGVVGAEGRDALRHQAVLDDVPDLGLRP
jgi:hypothetical protein